MLLLALVAWVWLPQLVSASISRDWLRFAVVDTGPVEATIAATGLVVPEIQQVLASPVDARVLRILSGLAPVSMRASPSSNSTSARRAWTWTS